MNVPLIGRVGKYTLSSLTWATLSAFFVAAKVTNSVSGVVAGVAVASAALCGAKALAKVPEALIELRSGY